MSTNSPPVKSPTTIKPCCWFRPEFEFSEFFEGTNMEYRRLGSLNISLVGIGCNNFGWRTDAAGSAAVVDAALDAGINFFDTADCYGAGQSEEFLGAALKN